jgi:type IV secretory pathway TrbL component
MAERMNETVTLIERIAGFANRAIDSLFDNAGLLTLLILAFLIMLLWAVRKG